MVRYRIDLHFRRVFNMLDMIVMNPRYLTAVNTLFNYGDQFRINFFWLYATEKYTLLHRSFN